MTEKLQDEIYQLENKQVKSAKLRGGGQKMLQNVLQSAWKAKYAKSNNIWITYTVDINQNILAVLRTFSNLQKKSWKTLHQRDNF